jgi:hypothetical protein
MLATPELRENLVTLPRNRHGGVLWFFARFCRLPPADFRSCLPIVQMPVCLLCLTMRARVHAQIPFPAYRVGLRKRYRVGWCSLGALFWASTIIAVLLTPLYIAWVSHCTFLLAVHASQTAEGHRGAVDPTWLFLKSAQPCSRAVRRPSVHSTHATAPWHRCLLSSAFWLMEKTVFEQPDVAPLEQYYVLMEGTTSAGPFQSLWTSSNAANDLVGSSLRPCSVRVSSVH